MQSANPASSNVNHGNNVNHSSFSHGDVDRGKFSLGEGLVMAAEIRLSCSDSSSASSSKLPSSQYKGVVPQPNGRWGAQIYEKHNRVWLGTFNSEEDAARTYDRAVLKFRGRDAVTNFGPPEDSDPEALFVDRHSKEQIVDMLRRHTFDEEFQLKFEKPTLNFVSGPPGHFDTNHTANRDTNHTANHDTNHINYSNDNSRIMMKPAREHLFDKTVTPSDVGKLNRLVIPKQHAERCFPLDSDTSLKGLLLNFEDPGAKMWRFRYSYWNSSQSYVLTKGWSRFVKEKKLDAGDIISFERDVNHKLYISWHRRRQPTNYPYPTWLHQVYRPPPHSLVSLVGQSSAAATTTTRMHTLDGFKLQFLAPTSAIAIPSGLQPLYWNSPSHPQLLPQNPSQVISIPPPLPFLQFPSNMTDATDGNATGLGSTLGKRENPERPHDDAAGILPALARPPCQIADCNVSAMSPVTVSQGFRLFGVELRPSMPCLESISQANAISCSQNMTVSSPLNNQQSNIELRPSMPHLESNLCMLKSIPQANSLYRVQNTMVSPPSNDQQINKELRSSMPHLESDPHPSKLILHVNALSCGLNTMVSSLSNDQQTSKICSWSKEISLDGGMADTNNKQPGAEISMDQTLPNHIAKRPCIDKISSNQ